MFDYTRQIDEGKRQEPSITLNRILRKESGRFYRRIILTILLLIVGVLFLPWTQNIRSKGQVIALKPAQRPQAVQSMIDGQIKQWFVVEGQFVEKGDTLLEIGETKDDYLDPQLAQLTKEQLDNKILSNHAYEEKINALQDQLNALESQRKVKLSEIQNKAQQVAFKFQNDSIKNAQALRNVAIAKNQLDRAEQMLERGLRSQTEYEDKRLKFEKELAVQNTLENDLSVMNAELENMKLSEQFIRVEMDEKIAKTRSELATVKTDLYKNKVEIAKLTSKVNTIRQRMEQYYLRAPQDGFVTQIIRTGVGELIKEGTDVLTIMPREYDLAVETYVTPFNIPLLKIGQPVRIQFDGWPSVVFSGWPNTSVGTFSGNIIAIDNFIDANGKYRVIVAPDNQEEPWPAALRVGSGAQSIILLEEVRIYYEIWRQLNGFPPDFYEKPVNFNNVKLKAPAKSIK